MINSMYVEKSIASEVTRLDIAGGYETTRPEPVYTAERVASDWGLIELARTLENPLAAIERVLGTRATAERISSARLAHAFVCSDEHYTTVRPILRWRYVREDRRSIIPAFPWKSDGERAVDALRRWGWDRFDVAWCLSDASVPVAVLDEWLDHLETRIRDCRPEFRPISIEGVLETETIHAAAIQQLQLRRKIATLSLDVVRARGSDRHKATEKLRRYRSELARLQAEIRRLASA